MSTITVLSVIESPAHPDFSGLYRRLGFEYVKVNSMRKAISQVKKKAPDIVVAEFFYGFGNNYAGVNVSNLDVLMSTLQRYAPDAKVIAMVEKNQRQHVDKLDALFPLHGILVQPVRQQQMEALLNVQKASD